MSHVIPWVRYPRPKSQWSMVIVGETELNNKSIYIYIYIYYQLQQAYVTIWGCFVSLEIKANVVINWNSLIIPNWGKCF